MAKRTKKATVGLRHAVPERYVLDERGAAMRAAVGIRKPKRVHIDATQEIRALRRGSRIERIFFE